MLTVIEKLEDYANLVTEIQDLVTRVGFKNDQLICQGRSSVTDDWHLGIGSINDL